MFQLKIKKVKIDKNNKDQKSPKSPKNIWWQILNVIIFFVILISIYGIYDKLSKKETKRKKEEVSISRIIKEIDLLSINATTSIPITIEREKVLLEVGTHTLFVAKKENSESALDVFRNYGVSTATLNNLNIKIKENSSLKILSFLSFFIPISFLIIMIWFLIRGIKGANGSALSFGNSRAKLIDPEDEKNKITFKDVAGAKEAKQELEEVVDFLKNPKKFLDIGAKIPKGVLLIGNPGTGKTLLARAVAGEASVPFFHLSGSEFVEMFVGVGASRVRDLFKEAKENSPAIIFIDEIDAVGRSRGVGLGGGNDEREQTLNQILVEMDGFEPNEQVVILAATNRADVLDKALLRPGRFDRRVHIDLPDKESRVEILEVHKKNKKVEEDINLKVIAERTVGFSGADLYSVMNEAAILAARENKEKISQNDIIRSVEKVAIGPERKSNIFSKTEKEKVAYHEAGHALIASVLPFAHPVHKISIISRGHAGGVTWTIPLDDKRLMTKSNFIDEIATIYGGYAAECEVYGVVSTGPSSDLQSITNIARDMVMKYGMSEVVGPFAVENDEKKVIYGNLQDSKNISGQDLSNKIDDEVKKICEEGLNTAKRILKEKRDVLDFITKELLEKENIEREEFEKILEKFSIEVKR